MRLAIKMTANLCLLSTLLTAQLSLAQGPLCAKVLATGPQNIETGYVYLGDSIKDDLLKAIALAKDTLDIEMSMDPSPEIFASLRQRIKEGVKIRVIMDGRNRNKSIEYTKMWQTVTTELESMGIEYVVSDNQALSLARGYPRAALHRKLIIIDNKYFYLGSANVTRNSKNVEVGYFGPVKSIGSELKNLFLSDYNNAQKGWKRSDFENAQIFLEQAGRDSISILGPGTSQPDIRQVILSQIQNSKKQILISVYEAADKKILDALVDKKLSHPEIDIRVVLCQSKMSVWLAGQKINIEKNISYKDYLQKVGIDVREFANANMYNHSRFALFDTTVFGGSADFVNRSFKGNVDLAFLIKDQELARWSQNSFEELWVSSRNVPDVTLKQKIYSSFFDLVELMSYFFIQIKSFTLVSTK